MLEKLWAHGVNWQLALLMVLCYFVMRIKYIGNQFKNINTLFHECGHAIAALLVQGEIYHIKLNSNTSGEALTSTKGWFAKFLVAISGYLFPLFLVAVIILTNHYFRYSYSNYILLSIALVAGIMWIRNGYGYLWCLVYLSLGITPIFIHKAYLSKIWLMMNVACILIENIHATFYLVKLSFKSPKQAGDASSLQQATVLPASIWALFFLSISIVATFISLFAEHTLKFKIY